MRSLVAFYIQMFIKFSKKNHHLHGITHNKQIYKLCVDFQMVKFTKAKDQETRMKLKEQEWWSIKKQIYMRVHFKTECTMGLVGKSKQMEVCMKGNGRMEWNKVKDAWKSSSTGSMKGTGRMTCAMELDVKLTKTEMSILGISWEIKSMDQVSWNTSKRMILITGTGSKEQNMALVNTAGVMETLIRANSQKIKWTVKVSFISVMEVSTSVNLFTTSKLVKVLSLCPTAKSRVGNGSTINNMDGVNSKLTEKYRKHNGLAVKL